MSAVTHDIEAVGAVVYWSVNDTNRNRFQSVLDDLALDQFLPNKRTPESSLFNALKDLDRSKGEVHETLVQSHKDRAKNGFEVVTVVKGEDENKYEVAFTAKVDKTTEMLALVGKSLDLTAHPAIEPEVRDRYQFHRMTLTGSSVGSALVDICANLKGTSLRPSGGIYWLPPEAVATWDTLSEGLANCAVGDKTNTAYRLRTMLDHGSAKAVIDAITAEVHTQSAEVMDNLNELGDRALRTREERARELKQKVIHYEGILGEGLDKLKAVCEVARKSAAHAVLAQL